MTHDSQRDGEQDANETFIRSQSVDMPDIQSSNKFYPTICY